MRKKIRSLWPVLDSIGHKSEFSNEFERALECIEGNNTEAVDVNG